MSLSSGSVHESYPRAEDSYVLGLCTGSLAEAAVSASGSLSELLPLAVQAVLISLRLGLCTVAMRDRIETSNEHRSGSRSASVVGMDSAPANAAIEEFCKTAAVEREAMGSITQRAICHRLRATIGAQ
ncbi:hypothetical protein LTS02_016871 [Friedmanniomyces endolithicus]|nr:hypothetical protein LTS02_016871 [Friedmanniomyces endolithicus]